jgi:hypothetical protein
VVGIRSIGTTLGAIVAAGLGAGARVWTVRPVGPPFERRLALDPAWPVGWASAARIALVDEGPGLSGSSFGAVLDTLESARVPASSMVVLPSHAGELGPAAHERARERWRRLSRYPVDVERLLRGQDGPGLLEWVRDVVGPVEGPLEDIGAGGWRRHLYADERRWPAVHAAQERRKYLLPAGGQRWLLKFSGLGRYGEQRLERARQLAAAGFTPEVTALRHGFLIAPWIEGARPLTGTEPARAPLLDRIADYLGFRARACPARAEASGASPAELWQMALKNLREALLPEAARELSALEPALSALAAAARPVEIDGKLQPHEWLKLPDGRVLKTDALDHHQGHDLIGCQDIAWDVAGVVVEWSLSALEAERFRRAVSTRAGREVTSLQLRFYTACYGAFALGAVTLAALWAAEASEEGARLAARRDFLARGYWLRGRAASC